MKPVETSAVVGAIHRDGLSRLEPDRPAQKSIDSADFMVQLGEPDSPIFADRRLAVSPTAQQLIEQIRDREARVFC